MPPEVSELSVDETLRLAKRHGVVKRAEFQEDYHDAIRAVLPKMLTAYISDILTTDDPEVRRKGIAYFSQVIGVEADKKVEAGSTRAVVTINFGGPAPTLVQQVVVAEIIVQDVIDVRGRLDAEEAPGDELDDLLGVARPSALMQANRYINDEMLDDAA